MKLKIGDKIMYEAEMTTIVAVDSLGGITLEWEDDDGASHEFGPFDKSEYREWPVL